MQRLVPLYDNLTESTLDKQVTDPGSKYAGGIMDASGIPRPNHGGTPSVMACWACALVNPQSRYYRDAGLLSALDLAADFMLNRQHPDGTISLGSTNFNSPPDTGFVVGGVTQIYQLLARQEWPEAEPAAAKLRLFLERTIPAMLTGGCHTPNHRWVLTAALSLLYELFGLPELVERADEWLAEGLDITQDGEWTERSNGIYNAVSDIALYHTGRILHRPELLEAVRRNLQMMVYMVHPSGEVVTDYSGRQDFGHSYSMATYFLAYRFMAVHDQDPLFASMADYCETFIQGPEGVNNNALLQLMVYPQLTDTARLERQPLPDSYELAVNLTHPIDEQLGQMESVGHHMQIQHSSMHVAFGAPVVRIREKDTSVTIMTRTPSFFSLRHGSVRLLGVKLASSFSPGAVKFDHVEMNNGMYKLDTVMSKGYTGPIPKHALPEGRPSGEVSPWYLLPHQLRPATHVQTHRLTAELTPGASEWHIRIASDEREDVATQLTFILGVEGTLSGEGLERVDDNRYSLKNGPALYKAGDQGLEIMAGVQEHGVFTIRNDQHEPGCQYLHINLVTPFDQTFTIKLL